MNIQSGRASRSSHRIVPALVVIAIGAFFLLGNLGVHWGFLYLQNWWAWLIMVGAIGPASMAMQRYRARGTVDGEVLHYVLNAAIIVMVALIFLLQLSWGQWWPVFVIYGGLCMLVRHWKDTANDTSP